MVIISNLNMPCICCHTNLWNIDVRKQAINDKVQVQGTSVTYLRCGRTVDNQTKKLLLLSQSVKIVF